MPKVEENRNVHVITEGGSFRDENSRVYYAGETILRGISESALEDYLEYSKSGFFLENLDSGRIVGTALETDSGLAEEVLANGWAGVLRHNRIPFVSYPYEWPFGMLKDAALLHLDILERSIPAGWVLKDSTPTMCSGSGFSPALLT